MFQSLRQTAACLVNYCRRFPEMLAAALKERQRQAVAIEQEAERLDRIRNPSKYRGK
jgi:hypothetical protein